MSGRVGFRFSLQPLVESARLDVDHAEAIAARAQEAVAKSRRCLAEHLLRLRAAKREEQRARAALEHLIASRCDLARLRGGEHAIHRAMRSASLAAIEVDAAGERLAEAERRRAEAVDRRDAAIVALKELLRQRERAEAAFRRAEERRQERKLEDEVSERRWGPAV